MIVSSVMIEGIRPVVKLSKDLEMKIVEKAADDLISQEEYEKARESHAVDGEVLADTTYKDGMLYRKGKIWLPHEEALKKMVFENEYDPMDAGHIAIDKTLEMINRNFYWPRMAKDIEDYVCSCDDCQRNKAFCHKRHGTLHPLELSNSPWDSISMDFITHLPVSEDCSTLWVIRYTKMALFVPVKNAPKTAEGCAKRFPANVWKLHGHQSDIVSDHDPVFTSTFWAELIKKLDVHLRKSTAFRPQTDGQIERINSTLEHYLRQ